jgi:hypothetical protein
MLVRPDLRVAPERDVVRLGGRRQQARLLLGIERLARQPQGARVPAHAVLLERPVVGTSPGVVDALQPLSAKAVFAYRLNCPLDAPLGESSRLHRMMHVRVRSFV